MRYVDERYGTVLLLYGVRWVNQGEVMLPRDLYHDFLLERVHDKYDAISAGYYRYGVGYLKSAMYHLFLDKMKADKRRTQDLIRVNEDELNKYFDPGSEDYEYLHNLIARVTSELKTDRQRGIFRLILQGMTNKEIAQEFSMSCNAVYICRCRINKIIRRCR